MHPKARPGSKQAGAGSGVLLTWRSDCQVISRHVKTQGSHGNNPGEGPYVHLLWWWRRRHSAPASRRRALQSRAWPPPQKSAAASARASWAALRWTRRAAWAFPLPAAARDRMRDALCVCLTVHPKVLPRQPLNIASHAAGINVGTRKWRARGTHRRRGRSAGCRRRRLWPVTRSRSVLHSVATCLRSRSLLCLLSDMLPAAAAAAGLHPCSVISRRCCTILCGFTVVPASSIATIVVAATAIVSSVVVIARSSSRVNACSRTAHLTAWPLHVRLAQGRPDHVITWCAGVEHGRVPEGVRQPLCGRAAHARQGGLGGCTKGICMHPPEGLRSRCCLSPWQPWRPCRRWPWSSSLMRMLPAGTSTACHDMWSRAEGHIMTHALYMSCTFSS